MKRQNQNVGVNWSLRAEEEEGKFREGRRKHIISKNVVLHNSDFINLRSKLVMPWDVAVNHASRLAYIFSSSDISELHFIETEDNIDMIKRAQLG